MIEAFGFRARLLPRSAVAAASTAQRHLSFASVINRGIRRTKERSGRLGSTPRSEVDNRDLPRNPTTQPRSRIELQRSEHSNDRRLIRRRRDHHVPSKDTISHEAPIAKPYTTAGSEFLYGTFAVKAALEAKRRKLYKLYIWRGERSAQDAYDHSIFTLAKAQKIAVQFVAGSWDDMLARMSGQRPHNGYVLEASSIPKLPVISLQPLDHPGADILAKPAAQSSEDEAVNSIFETSVVGRIIPRTGGSVHYPLLLWLDRITDSGNLGAIVRTAHFMGVDAIIVPEHGTAPLSPITIKASAGAAETLPIMVVKRELDFVRMSQANGWKFVAAVAPNSQSTWKQLSQQGSFVAENVLHRNPCVLMLGNEGEGLRGMMQKAADHFVSIRGGRGHASGVESLNVSVAAALLMARLLSKASSPEKVNVPAQVEQEPALTSKAESIF